MVKTFVTLDPEYIPWAPQTPTVKLRHKRNKLIEFLLPLAMGIIAIGGIWLFVNRGALSQGDGNSSVGADAAGATSARESASATLTASAPGLDYQGWCVYGGILLSPGAYHIGDHDRECKNGNLLP